MDFWLFIEVLGSSGLEGVGEIIYLSDYLSLSKNPHDSLCSVFRLIKSGNGFCIFQELAVVKF